MTEWKSINERPEGVFDVLARWYDAGLDRFILCRFTNCVLVDLRFIWGSPFQGDTHSVDLQSQGYRVVCWAPAPGPEDVPTWIEAFVTGPQDRNE